MGQNPASLRWFNSTVTAECRKKMRIYEFVRLILLYPIALGKALIWESARVKDTVVILYHVEAAVVICES